MRAVHLAWGATLLDSVPFRGDETVVDAGCGCGQLAELLLRRLPRVRVVALDESAETLSAAAARLAPFRSRVSFVCADATHWVASPRVDVVLSNAVLHWIADHEALFAAFVAGLRPLGRLLTQCAVAARLHAAAHDVALRAPYAQFLERHRPAWAFPTVDETLRRLSTGRIRGRLRDDRCRYGRLRRRANAARVRRGCGSSSRAAPVARDRLERPSSRMSSGRRAVNARSSISASAFTPRSHRPDRGLALKQ